MLTLELVNEKLYYCKETGVFTYKTKHLKSRRPIGSIAGSIEPLAIRIKINGKKYAAHRLAWFITYGEWPNGMIDHKNCNPHDNRIDNLRIANEFENARNKSRQRNSKTGVKGVQWKPKRGTYFAKITFNKNIFHLGEFSNIQDASDAYNAAAKRMHGEFAHLSSIKDVLA